MTLAREVAGLAFSNPILLAAGTAGFGHELRGVCDLDRLGGLVTKAVSLQPRAGNAAPRVAEFRGGMLNSVGLANPGVERVATELLPRLLAELRGPQVLVNVVGFTQTEYAEVIKVLEQGGGPAGYELNLSCPNSSAGGIEFGADPRSVAAVVSAARLATSRPLFVKLSPALADIPTIALAAREAGADGVSLVNTLPGMVFDGGAPRLGNGFGGVSGPALLATGLLAVQRVRNRVGDLAIIGVGGIRSAADVRQYLLAGADLVAIGTAALAHPRIPERILAELERNDG
ncbi:MAG: dihydroorotate dehydrogenase [Gemmatimonadales bacterium]|nr:dihydroorotate dehydrogenase [Gemmatimonadales bacterium]MDZ4389867.1 dihydroorotate dehydrogenase [Gemmatimonadales bacterium]